MKVEWKASSRSLFRIIAGAAALALVLTGVVAYRSCAPGVVFEDGRAFAATLEPLSSDSLGVAPDSAFILRLDRPVPLASVRSALSVEPRVGLAVKVEDQEGRVFKVSADEALKADRVYRFRLALAGPNEPGYSWAFQVAGQLRIAGSLPADRSSGVPLNTGIEIEFSHEGVDEPGSFFTITPFVPGSWQRHRRTLVYVPAVPLQRSTVYTCTVKQGLGLQDSDKTLGADYTFAFETAGVSQQAPSSWFYVDTSEVEFAPTEPPFFSVSYGVYGKEATALPKVAAKVYRYRDAAAYVATLEERAKVPFWADLSRQNWKPPTAGLEPVLETDLQIQTYQWQTYLVLPRTLDPGYYLACFRYESSDCYAWIQVTDLSGYTLEATNDTVVWFNSLASGRPVEGVTLRQAGSGVPLGTSNADGLARFATPAALVARDRSARDGGSWVYGPQPPFYAVAKAPDGSEVALNLSPYWNSLDSRMRRLDEYWSYLYTDRPLYLPDDEVCFWGVLQPRERGASEVARARVELRSSYGVWGGPFGGEWNEGGESDANFVSRVEVDIRRHTFGGRLKLPNLRPGSYYLTLNLDGVDLVTRYFEVATYTKPAYRLTLTADKKAVFAGETVSFSLNAAFFEGTPVSELRLDYSLGSGDTTLSGGLRTDVTGRATLAHTPKVGTNPLTLNRRDWLSVSADLPESGPIWAESGVRVFEKDVALRASALLDPAGARIEAKLNKVTLDRINTPAAGGAGAASPDWSGWFSFEAFTGDPVAARDIAGQLFEVHWEAHETGQYYDFVEKVTRKTYEYTEVKVPVQAFTMTTGPDGVASHLFPVEPAKSYFIRLDSRDDAGRAIASEFYFHGHAYVGPDYGHHWYHLSPSGREQAKYAVGETATVVAEDGEAVIPGRTKGFLFYSARRGLAAVEVKDGPEYSLVFSEDLIPNTNVGAVYFDGRYYNEVYSLPVTFDYSVRKLDVSVKTDKESYAPGEKVAIEVEVKDAEGRPVGAEVNLCAVDEALYHLSGQSVDLLGGLYRRMVPAYVVLGRGTHYQRLEGGAAAESGGEGGGVRDTFLDNALFESLTTGADGRGRVEMTLPDNLTSWRITYQAFASGVRAGSGMVDVPVRLPFFVELSMNETYLAGDKPVIQARAYGAALPPGTAVTFSGKLARLAGDSPPDEKDIAALTGTAFRPSGLVLGVLEKGRYRLTVTGTATLPDGKVLEDTLAKPIDVLDTYLRLDRVDYYQVGEGLRVTAEPGELATLTFSDQERGKYLQLLWRLAGGGRRADMKAAAVVAHRLLVEYFGYEEPVLWPPPTASDLLICQRDDGGVGLLPYGSSNLELTAKIAALGEAGFDRDGLLTYLGRVYDSESDNRERLIVALYGLAALDQPVLADLQKVATGLDLSAKEKLYACLGLIELGDEETARGLFGGVLEAHGDRIGPLLRLNVSRDQEEIIAATSLAAVIAAELRMDSSGALSEYLLDNTPWEELNLIELALFLQATVPGAPSEPVSFTLQPDGTSVTLKPGETYTCLRTAEDLAGLGFSSVSGNVGLCVSYRAPANLSGVKGRGDQAGVERSYSAGGGAGKATTVFHAGDVVKVVLRYNVTGQAPEGPYQLVDFLPSGLKAVPRSRDLGIGDQTVDYPAEIDGQKVTFNTYFEPGPIDPKTGKPKPRGGSGTAVYYARVVSLGDFQADQAVLIHAKSGDIFAMSKKDQIEIK